MDIAQRLYEGVDLGGETAGLTGKGLPRTPDSPWVMGARRARMLEHAGWRALHPGGPPYTLAD